MFGVTWVALEGHLGGYWGDFAQISKDFVKQSEQRLNGELPREKMGLTSERSF